jgi:predicted component of type VI protein secretion system
MTSPTHQLIMRSGPTPEKVYELTQPVIFLGRDFANEIVINDPEVSRRHARLTAQTGGYILEDTGSTNGTFVNGQRLLGPHLLRPGELVSFGGSVLLSYEALQFDPNATLAAPVNLPPYQAPTSSYDAAYVPPASQPAQVDYVQPAQPARQTYSPASVQPAVQAPPSYYSGQIPQNPPETERLEPKKSGSRGWILLGIGCLLVFLCVCVGVAYVFDTLNLYCLAPFNSLFSWLYTCP